jgi:hypothetical protein
VRAIALLTEQEGNDAATEQWYRYATGFGCYLWLARFLKTTGRRDEAGQIRKFGVEPGGKTAEPWGPRLHSLDAVAQQPDK